MTQEELKILQGMFESSEKRMSQMMDDKLEAQEKRTDEKFSSLRQEMTANNESLRQDMAAQEKRTDEKFSSLRQEMTANNESLRQDMAAQEKRTDEKFRSLEQQIHGIDMRLDRDFKEIKGLLKDDYGRVEKNAAKGAAAADSCKELRSIQTDHAVAIRNHHERITVLEEKAI